VHEVRFVREKNVLLLKIQADKGYQLELWALEEHQKYFVKTFGERFGIQVTASGF